MCAALLVQFLFTEWPLGTSWSLSVYVCVCVCAHMFLMCTHTLPAIFFVHEKLNCTLA